LASGCQKVAVSVVFVAAMFMSIMDTPDPADLGAALPERDLIHLLPGDNTK